MSNSLRPYDPTSGDNRPLWGLFFKWVLACVVVVIVLGAVGFGMGWIGAAKDVVSPTNVKAQFHDAYSSFESLKAIAGNVCDAQSNVDNATNEDLKAQYQTHLDAYKQNYRRVAAKYDAAYDNAFEAKHVGPHDLPRPAPSLQEAEKLYC